MRRFSPPSKRASILLVSMILLTLASLMLASMARAIVDNGRVLDRKADSMKALQAAEAGLAHAIDHFNRPSKYSEDVTYGTNPFVPNPEDPTDFSEMQTFLEGGDLVLDAAEYPPLFYTADGGSEREVAALTEVRLMPLTGAVAGFRDICIVRSTAVSGKYGIERAVEATLRGPINFRLRAPAALLSYDKTVTGGNVRVHWGDSWSKGDVTMSSNPSTYNTTYGPTGAIRSEGNIIFGNSGQWDIPSEVQSSTTITDIWPESGSEDIRTEFAARLYQNQTLEFPEYDYAELKQLSQLFGRYYGTDAEGNLYIDGIKDEAHLVTIDEVTAYSSDTFVDNGEESEASTLVFIDTIDGLEPAADQSNLAPLKMSGGTDSGNRFMRGFWFINAQLDISGVGSTAVSMTVPVPAVPEDWTSTVSWPTGNETIDVISDGVLLIAGTLQITGQPGFRGSLITLKDISGNGTPNVFYDPDLKTGKDIKALSNVEVSSWRILK